jgi:hypothetical protein
LAQVKPEYEAIPEFKQIAAKLVDKYPEVLNGVNASEIQCVGVTNKEPKDGRPTFEIKPVPMPIRMDCPYTYYVILNKQDWDGMDNKHQALMAFDVLCSISPDGDGKVIPFDLKDHAVVVRTVGCDYLSRPDVPDILTDDIKWQKE